MGFLARTRLAAVLWLCLTPALLAASHKGPGAPKAPAAPEEVQFPSEEFKLLDATEAQALAQADRVFGQKDFKRAVAEYESFILGFGKSRAVAYAILRKGRALELSNKRHEAIRVYRELLDYFPNAVAYAAPALYYTGYCHEENGDLDKALKAWSDLAADAGYRRHPLAAEALNGMADELEKRGQPDKALPCYEQVAEDFRTANPDAAHHAIAAAAACHVSGLNEPKLRAFYERVKTFAKRPEKPGPNAPEDRPYWEQVCELVRRHGHFEPNQDGARDAYYRYWAGQLEGKFPNWDEFQLDLARFALVYEKETAKFSERLDRQFGRGFKAGDFGRVIEWMRLYAGQKNKVQEYYQKLDFAQMTNARIEEVMKLLYDEVKDADLGRNVFQKLRRNELDDAEKQRLAVYFFQRDEGVVKDLCAAIQEKDLGKFVLLEFYCGRKDAQPALALADELAGSPKFAKEALRHKAELLEQLKQYDKAIPAWRQLDEPPATLYRIADCFAHLNKLEDAVTQLREIESFFKDQSSAAAYKIARLLREAGQDKRYIAQLRYLMKSYPKSKESNSAHLELEKLGAKIGGGVDAEQ